MIGWLKELQRRRRVSRAFVLALKTETDTYNVVAAARMYYVILYGKQAPF